MLAGFSIRRKRPYAPYACIYTWLTDFRGDLPKIDIPADEVNSALLTFLGSNAGDRRQPMEPVGRL